MNSTYAALIAKELGVAPEGVLATLQLLAEKATVPFIARYRKEATRGLDEVQIRTVAERAEALADVDARRAAILESIESQGKLTDALRRAITAATTKTELEDLYLPYKPKRRTRASDAKDKGLEPLADMLLAQKPNERPDALAGRFVSADKGVADTAAALAGARDILAERIADKAEVRAAARHAMKRFGVVESKPARGKKDEPDAQKYRDYFEFGEPVRKIPPHRVLALRRGTDEKFLSIGVALPVEPLEVDVAPLVPVAKGRTSPCTAEVVAAVKDGLERLVLPSIEREVLGELEDEADRAAADVFAKNLEAILLAAPLGPKRVVAIDPGLRTGMKCVALDATGRFLANTTVHTIAKDSAARATADLAAFLRKFAPDAIAVGNGTGGREAMTLARAAVAESGSKAVVIEVNEAGASVYSASDTAREEHPDLDLTIRGAISIGRRLQDPLAELVKIEPKSVGVGQYQHDVAPKLLDERLSAVVETCVNRVGVSVNTASPALLAHVAGIGPTLAKRIAQHREANGPFETRKALRDVPGLGPKAFEQAAGFLRVAGGPEPLDASAVHPERYELVTRMAKDLGVSRSALIGDAARIATIPLSRYVGPDVGLPTLNDIIAELSRPGRDPRRSFEPPKWRDDVTTLDDVRPGMTLDGVVTNVVQFGAFVDVGVHQDGLVHVSELADKFVRDPSEVVAPGDRVRVLVLEVDRPRKRLALSIKKAGKSG